MIAARQIAFGRSAKKWINPYITDGLIAMCDGEWNAGGGKHDSNANTCVNLVTGEKVEAFKGGHSFDDQSIVLTYGTTGYFRLNGLPIDGNATLDVVAVGETFANYMQFISFKRTGSYESGYLKLEPNNEKLGWGIGNVIASFDAKISAKTPQLKSATITNGVDVVSYTNGENTDIRTSAKICISDTLFVGGVNGALDAVVKNLGGRIFCVRLYNRALTADEIAHNYEIDKARFNI